MPNPRGAAFWIFMALLVVVHFGLHLGLGLGASAPDLLTVAVLIAARRLTGWAAAVLGLLLGLLQDALSLLAFGAEAVTQALLGYAGARSRDLFVGDSAFWFAGYLFAGKWLHDIVFFLLGRVALGGNVVSRLLVEAPIAGLYAAACGVGALLVYKLVTGER